MRTFYSPMRTILTLLTLTLITQASTGCWLAAGAVGNDPLREKASQFNRRRRNAKI
jgi:hypothetical protein